MPAARATFITLIILINVIIINVIVITIIINLIVITFIKIIIVIILIPQNTPSFLPLDAIKSRPL